MRKCFLSVFKDKKGVSALEYAILAGIVVLGVTAGTNGLRADISGILTSVTSAMTAANTAAH